MKYEITEEQIKELAKGNAKVKKMFPEVFETLIFKEGNWYYDKGNDWLFCYKGENRAFGFVRNVYSNDYYICSTLGFKPATDTEVLEALTNEAKKKGFKEGVYVKPLWGTLDYWELDTNRFAFNSETNNLHLGPCVFNNGKWAEIIKTYTKKEAEKLLNAKII